MTLRITVLIPLIGFKSVDKTIDSVLKQKCSSCEIIILRNGIEPDKIPGEAEIYENDTTVYKNNVPVREIFIQKKGKGNALNIGAEKAAGDLICVLDADCMLDKNAFSKIVRHFNDDRVIAAGGRLIASSEKKNLLTFIQQTEYEKTFNISRSIFNLLDANCLISGAFGIFRKKEFTAVNGYDPDTVGEDMELVLRLQKMMKPTGMKVIYDKESICYTGTPYTFRRLLKQRDRWQRGLLDCLIKHRKMLFNPKYGILGLVVLPYQLFCELFGPFLIVGQLILFGFIAADFSSFFELLDWLDFMDILESIDRLNPFGIYATLLGFESLKTCIAECIEQKTILITKKILIRSIAATIIGTIMSIPLAVARIVGMLTFHWRQLEW